MKANIGMTDKNRQAVADILNKVLADAHIIYMKTRNYHWNIEGSNFMEMHKLYESQYTELAEAIDEIAERIRQIGHYAEGRLKDFIKLTNLEEEDYTNDQKTQIKNLVEDHETVIRQLRTHINNVDEKYKDAGTADFLTGLLKSHEKWAWMLRVYVA